MNDIGVFRALLSYVLCLVYREASLKFSMSRHAKQRTTVFQNMLESIITPILKRVSNLCMIHQLKFQINCQ